jgi:uncharacterized lipoprotein YmbA
VRKKTSALERVERPVVLAVYLIVSVAVTVALFQGRLTGNAAAVVVWAVLNGPRPRRGRGER